MQFILFESEGIRFPSIINFNYEYICYKSLADKFQINIGMIARNNEKLAEGFRMI